MRPQSEDRVIPRVPLFSPRINSRSKKAWPARPQPQKAEWRYLGCESYRRSRSCEKHERKKQPLKVLPQIFRHHFSLDFPNTNNPSDNSVHIWTNYPILNPMQGTRSSPVRGSPCPQIVHSLNEESGKIYHKLSHKSTEELGKTSWKRWHPLSIRRGRTGGALEPEAWWSGLQCLWSKTRKSNDNLSQRLNGLEEYWESHSEQKAEGQVEKEAKTMAVLEDQGGGSSATFFRTTFCGPATAPPRTHPLHKPLTANSSFLDGMSWLNPGHKSSHTQAVGSGKFLAPSPASNLLHNPPRSHTMRVPKLGSRQGWRLDSQNKIMKASFLWLLSKGKVRGEARRGGWGWRQTLGSYQKNIHLLMRAGHLTFTATFYIPGTGIPHK